MRLGAIALCLCLLGVLGAQVYAVEPGGEPLPAAAPATGWWMPAPAQNFASTVGIRRDLYREALNLSAEQQPLRDYDVDLKPLLDNVLGYVHAVGIPLRPDQEMAGPKGIAFSASWRVRPDMPAVNFHIGDTGPLDAFYANDGGFRWALSWLVQGAGHVALHLEGGEDSEFGTWAIAGAQWRDPHRPLAIGIGVPVSMNGVDGDVGVLIQLRMLLR